MMAVAAMNGRRGHAGRVEKPHLHFVCLTVVLNSQLRHIKIRSWNLWDSAAQSFFANFSLVANFFAKEFREMYTDIPSLYIIIIIINRRSGIYFPYLPRS